MIFKPKPAKQVLVGQKTQIRQPRKSEDCTYSVGRTYSVQKSHGEPEIARIKVVEVRHERLNEISDKDVRREGFKKRQEFLRAWQERYDSTDQTVWVISFELAGDLPLYLARPVVGRQGDYTRNRSQAIDDLEAIDRPTQDRFTEQARARPHSTTVELWRYERERLAESVARLEADASPLLASEIRVLKRRLEIIDRKLERAA